MVTHQNARSNTKLIQPDRQDLGGSTPGTRKAVCSACRRIADRFPAGRVELGGAFLQEHREVVRFSLWGR